MLPISSASRSTRFCSRHRRWKASLGDSRFTFYRQSENGGEYGRGWFFFQQSQRCDLLLILHDDDVLLPEFLEVGANALQAEPKAAFFVANGYAMEHDGRRSAALTDRISVGWVGSVRERVWSTWWRVIWIAVSPSARCRRHEPKHGTDPHRHGLAQHGIRASLDIERPQRTQPRREYDG
jgi:hypothetical protein